MTEQEQAQPKRRRRGRPKKQEESVSPAGPINVTVTMKTGEKMTFTCFQQYEDGPFVVFLSPGTQGRVLKRKIAIDSMALLAVEEFPIQTRVYRQEGHFEGPRPGVLNTYRVDGPPVLQSQAPQENTQGPQVHISPGIVASRASGPITFPDGTGFPGGLPPGGAGFLS